MNILNHRIIKNEKSSEWVVFLHGLGGGLSVWFKQIREFSKTYNLILIDLPGHGASSYGLKDMKGYSFNDISMEVLNVLDFNNIERAHFVGISLGTIIIQVINEIAHERVSSMILGGAVEWFNLSSKAIIKTAYLIKNIIPYMTLYKASAWILMPKSRHKESRKIFIKEAIKLGQQEFLCWYRLTKEAISIFKCLKKNNSNTPRLYIMGEEDYMFLPYIKRTIDNKKNESLSIIKKCGHVCNIEKSKEFNMISLEFLNDLNPKFI